MNRKTLDCLTISDSNSAILTAVKCQEKNWSQKWLFNDPLLLNK